MSHSREKAQGFTKQLIGEMIGDRLLVQEGKEQQQHADEHNEAPLHDDAGKLPRGDRSG